MPSLILQASQWVCKTIACFHLSVPLVAKLKAAPNAESKREGRRHSIYLAPTVCRTFSQVLWHLNLQLPFKWRDLTKVVESKLEPSSSSPPRPPLSSVPGCLVLDGPEDWNLEVEGQADLGRASNHLTVQRLAGCL